MENGYLLIADVLGFSKIVTNSVASQSNGVIQQWLDLVSDATNHADLDRQPQLISDTVFASASLDATGLRKLVKFSRFLLEKGVAQSILVRGAITNGSFEWGQLTYGRAVIDAHKMETNQDWIGISCQGETPHAVELWGPDGLVCYPPPLKQGLIGLCPVVVWDVPEPHELQHASTREPLVLASEFLEWPWLRRLRNTAHFGAHLRSLSKDDIGVWQTFYGKLF